MKHTHEKTGMVFEVGELMEPGGGKTYDIMVITYWADAESDAVSPVTIVDYYFGDYDNDTTDYYIDKWLASFARNKQ